MQTKRLATLYKDFLLYPAFQMINIQINRCIGRNNSKFYNKIRFSIGGIYHIIYFQSIHKKDEKYISNKEFVSMIAVR